MMSLSLDAMFMNFTMSYYHRWLVKKTIRIGLIVESIKIIYIRGLDFYQRGLFFLKLQGSESRGAKILEKSIDIKVLMDV